MAMFVNLAPGEDQGGDPSSRPGMRERERYMEMNTLKKYQDANTPTL